MRSSLGFRVGNPIVSGQSLGVTNSCYGPALFPDHDGLPIACILGRIPDFTVTAADSHNDEAGEKASAVA